MYNDYYQLYLTCFKDYPISEDLFYQQLQPDRAIIISRHDENRLIAYALLHDNSVSLLCVDPSYRNQGIGSRLLELAEAHIRQKGFNQIILGRGKHYLLQGVPVNADDSPSFFEKRGYRATWTSINMMLDCKQFDPSAFHIPPIPADVKIQSATPQLHAQLLSAVDRVNANWVSCYESCNDPILIAVQNDSIVGFLIAAPDGGRFHLTDEMMGSIGCVGVIPTKRNQGIGRQLVAYAVQWLSRQGCSAIELRYVALIEWYQAVGFRVFHSQWMGEKFLNAD